MTSFLILVLFMVVASCSGLDKAARTSASAVLQGAVELNSRVIDTYSRHLRSRKERRKKHTLKGSLPFYHTSDELYQEAKRVAQNCQNMASVRTRKVGDVAIDVVRVRAQQAVPPINRAFLLFGEHSRELIGPESGLHFLKVLCGDVPLPKGAPEPTTVLRNTEFELVLNGNPRSRRRVEEGQWCVRTNPNGVDLNRNWDVEWKESDDDDGKRGTAAGPRPFSEPETQIVKQLIIEFEPTTFLSVHSGTRGLYMPWAYDSEHMAQRNQKNMMQLLRDVDKAHCQCPFGAAGKEVGYDCPGTSIDWVFAHTNASFSFAWEIFVGDDDEVQDLQEWWAKKVREGGMMLMQAGAHLSHSFFHDFFQQHPSDFVHHANGTNSNIALLQTEPFASDEECLEFYNPTKEERYHREVENWSAAYLDMAARAATATFSSPLEQSKKL